MIEREPLALRVARSFLYSGVSTAVVKLINFVSYLIVVKILAREEFGLVSIVFAVFTIVQAITELGLGLALIQKKDLTREQIDSLFWASLILSGIVYGLLFAAAPVLAWFYGEAELAPLLQVYGLGIVLYSIYVVPRNLLIKDLRFGRIAVIEAIPQLGGSATMVAMAYMGYGPWAVMFNELVARSGQLVLSYVFRPYLPRLSLGLGKIKDMIAFGLYTTGSRLLFNFYSNADYLIVGKIFGMEAVAIYTVAYKLVSDPVRTLVIIINKVAYPTFAKLQDETRRLRRYLFAISRASCIISGLVLIFIVMHADWAMEVGGYHHYLDAVPLIQILAVVGVVRTVSPLMPQLLNALGKARLNFFYSIMCSVVIPCAILIGSRYELVGVAWARSIVFPAVTLVLSWLAARSLGLSIAHLVTRLYAGLLVLVPVVLAAAGLRVLLGNVLSLETGHALLLSVCIITPAGLLFAWFMERDNLRLAFRKPGKDEPGGEPGGAEP